MERQRIISMAAAARRIGVSVATIRNWLNSGELQRGVDAEGAQRGVAEESVERYEMGRSDSGRLRSRANKRYKGGGRSRVLRSGRYDETLGDARRNREGVYYTPRGVVRDMLSVAQGDDLSDKLFLDPCCGDGNFIVEALEMGFSAENIYGYEIDPRAAQIARDRLYELTGQRTKNIICGDFFEESAKSRRRYDYCVTNPPWGRKMALEERREIAARYSLTGGADSSSLFLVAALKLLRDGGRLSFLVQEAMFNVRSYEGIRRYIFDYDVVSLVDYGHIFPSLITSAVAVTIKKEAAQQQQMIACRTTAGSYLRTRESIRCNPYLIFNIWASPDEAELIERLYAAEHTTLKGAARWGLGVVTGDNARYLSREREEGYVEVVKGADILPESSERWGSGRLRRGEQFLFEDTSRYQQVAQLELYRSPEKLIYKFISTRLSFALDREQLFTLNSANFLIPNSDFPLSSEQLLPLLNSDFMSWLFRAVFHTRKVLRGDIESLPIFPQYFTPEREFDEESFIKWLSSFVGVDLTTINNRIRPIPLPPPTAQIQIVERSKYRSLKATKSYSFKTLLQ